MKREGTAAIVTFVVTFALVPSIRHLCQRWQVFDRPDALKIHAKPIPRLGGIAIFLGVLAGIFASDARDFTAHWQFPAAIFVIWFTGLIDDLRGLPPASRLGAQILCAFLLWQGGLHILAAATAPTQIALICLFIILFVNSFNFLDGSDGLAGSVSLAIAVSYLAMPRTALTPLGFLTALCTAAACVAFLPFNRYPASIFLGDSGSTLLGFLLACIGLDIASTTAAPRYSIVLALTIAALPLLDALRVVTKRIARGASPLSGDRHHFYDALLARGWAPRRLAVVSWMMATLCGAIAVSIVRLRASIAWSLAAFMVAAAFLDMATASREKSSAADCDEAGVRSDKRVFVSAGKGSKSDPQEGEEL